MASSFLIYNKFIEILLGSRCKLTESITIGSVIITWRSITYHDYWSCWSLTEDWVTWLTYPRVPGQETFTLLLLSYWANPALRKWLTSGFNFIPTHCLSTKQTSSCIQNLFFTINAILFIKFSLKVHKILRKCD